jgi:hypothetical protein
VPDEPLSTEAMTILRYATVADIKADALELAKLWSELNEPERARLLALVFGPEL